LRRKLGRNRRVNIGRNGVMIGGTTGAVMTTGTAEAAVAGMTTGTAEAAVAGMTTGTAEAAAAVDAVAAHRVTKSRLRSRSERESERRLWR
jgi:ABC-type uncharacterized transport system permease subunit